MKLSEAMKKGIAQTEPLKEELITFDDGCYRACSMGCALVGVLGTRKVFAMANSSEFGIFTDIILGLGFEGITESNVQGVTADVIEWNDTYDMPRAEIAKRLEERGL